MADLLISIIVYVGLGLAMFALTRHFALRECRGVAVAGPPLALSWQVWLSVALFAAVAGVRYHTGYDHQAYMEQYLTLQKYGFFTREFEPGFVWLTRAVSSTGAHYSIYFFVLAAVEMLALCCGLSEHRDVLPWVLLLLMLGPTFVHLMNTVRQGIVECFVPLLLCWVSRRRFLLFVVTVLLLATIHYAALILLPVGLLWKVGANWRRWLGLALFVLAVALGTYPVWMGWLLAGLEPMLPDWFGSYAREMTKMLSTGFTGPRFGPIRLVLLLSQLLTLWFTGDILRHYASRTALPLFALLGLVYVLGTNLFCNTTCFFQRPFELFTICYVVMAAYAVKLMIDRRRRLMAAALVTVNCSYIFLAVVKATVTPSPLTSPFLYRFCFLN